MNSFVESFLKNYNQQSSGKINPYADKSRNHVTRYEIAASHLSSAVAKKDKKEVVQLINFLKKSRGNNHLWEEYPYGVSDEPIGYFGAVPSAFVLLSLAEAYQFSPDFELLHFMTESCDAFYRIENNGYILKAKTNKSNVLNTNLLVAMGMKEVAELLSPDSVRRKLYNELVRRVIRKTLGYQTLSGKFPYHFDTNAVPILYQAMVCAQIRYFIRYFDEDILYLSLKRGNRALKKFFDLKTAEILWKKANNHDKKGAVWAYSFALGALCSSDPLQLKIARKLRELARDGLLPSTDSSKNQDPFFTAWAYFGIHWSSKQAKMKERYSLSSYVKYGFLKIEYLFRYSSFLRKYLLNRVYNFPFHSGSLENRYWS